MVEFVAVVLAQCFWIDVYDAGNVGFGHAKACQRLDLAAACGIGPVSAAAHGSGLLKLGATLLAGRKGPRRYTGLITGAFGW